MELTEKLKERNEKKLVTRGEQKSKKTKKKK